LQPLSNPEAADGFIDSKLLDEEAAFFFIGNRDRFDRPVSVKRHAVSKADPDHLVSAIDPGGEFVIEPPPTPGLRREGNQGDEKGIPKQ